MHIISILDCVFTSFISHALITMTVTLCCREEKLVSSAEKIDTHSEDESAGASESAKPPSTRKRNSKGPVCLGNSVVSMRDLDLASRVPTKTRDDYAAKMFHAKLTLSKAYDGVLPSHAN